MQRRNLLSSPAASRPICSLPQPVQGQKDLGPGCTEAQDRRKNDKGRGGPCTRKERPHQRVDKASEDLKELLTRVTKKWTRSVLQVLTHWVRPMKSTCIHAQRLSLGVGLLRSLAVVIRQRGGQTQVKRYALHPTPFKGVVRHFLSGLLSSSKPNPFLPSQPETEFSWK